MSRFNTKFNGSTTIQTELNQIVDKISNGLSNNYKLNDDILVIIGRTKSMLWQKFWKAGKNCIENLRLVLEKCKNAEKEAEKLEFRLSQTGIDPLNC